jgi:cupin fold WbuC family metalloprotein
MTRAIRKISDEVFVAEDSIVRLGAADIAFLKQQAAASPRRRARICAHRRSEDTLHEMLIALQGDSYVHPHKHIGKSESFHIIEGRLDVAMLDDSGAIREVIELGDVSSGKPFFYRLADSCFHTLLIRSDYLIMHEVTNGPFSPGDAVLAPFAPPESRRAEVLAYLAGLEREAATLRHTHIPADSLGD